MKLGNRDVCPVFLSSGTKGFYGEGYPHHRRFPWSLADFSGATPVMKTMTLHRNEGNMPLREDGVTPAEKRPACIWVNPWNGTTLNAVGLSNFGLEFYLPKLHDLEGDFGISVMSIRPTATERICEMAAIIRGLEREIPSFIGHPYIEFNFSCPNVGLNTSELIGEVTTVLEMAASLGVPLVPNFSVEITQATASEISGHPACSAISIANTVKWGHLPKHIDWQKEFGTDVSPLAKFGGGGVSGPILLPLMLQWLRRAVAGAYPMKPLIIGGGIFSTSDISDILYAGGDLVHGIKLASVGIHRPWRVQRMIQYGTKRLNEIEKGRRS